jgi:ribulose-phosphate 3-epimerase
LRNRVQIAPSILSADFAHLADQIRAVERGGASILHLDVMDGHFVPNITIGPPVVASIRKATALPLDCHLMISEPDRYVSMFCEAGADMVSVHQEACVHLHRTLSHIRACGAAAGVVLNPATPVETLSEVLDGLDYVLLMSVNPGFGGQEFIPRTLDKIGRLAQMREARGLDFRIEIDGGVHPDNILEIVRAGAEWIVAGSVIFQDADPAGMVERLLKRAETATLTQI